MNIWDVRIDEVGRGSVVLQSAMGAIEVGIPSGVQVDAIGFSNGLVLSFDTDVSLPGGITAADLASGSFEVDVAGTRVL